MELHWSVSALCRYKINVDGNATHQIVSHMELSTNTDYVSTSDVAGIQLNILLLHYVHLQPLNVHSVAHKWLYLHVGS